jgi:hypothetical protein
MAKLITQIKTRYSSNKKFSLRGKSFGVIPFASNPSIGAWTLWGRVLLLLSDSLV